MRFPVHPLSFRCRIALLAIVLAACLPAALYGQVEVRKYSNEFLKIGLGARGFAMGNCQTAVVNDVSAGYWNPAGLASQDYKHEIGFMHSEYFAGIAKYDWAAYRFKIDSLRHIAGTFIRFGIDDIPNTLNLFDGNNIDYGRITQFSVADYAFLISYAQRFARIPGLQMGGNVKIVYRSIGPFATAWGFGLDLGLQYHRKGWSAGVMAMDISSTFNAWSFNTETYEDVFRQTGNDLPVNNVEVTAPSLYIGGGYNFLHKQKKFDLTLTVDVGMFFDGRRNTIVQSKYMNLDPKAGLEFVYNDLIYIRGGFYNLQENVNDEGERYYSVFPTAGVGFSIYKFTKVPLYIDYALSNIGAFDNSMYSHIISARLAFNKVKI